MSPRVRSGFVLAAVLLVLVAMTLLVHGLLVLMREQRRAAEVAWADRQARWAATGWVSGEIDALDRMPPERVERTARFGFGRAAITLRPLSREVVLVEVAVDSVGPAGRAAAAGLAWVLDPAMRVAALPRAAEVGVWPEPETLGRIEAPPTGTCEAETMPGAAGRPSVTVRAPTDTVDVARPPGLGLLRGDELSRRLDALPAGVGAPAPIVAGGVCTEGAWNWGDPDDDQSPCAERVAAVASPGGLRLEGGVGQGLVLVPGDLVVEGGRFRGILLVGGDLTIAAGAEVRGVVRVGGTLRVGTSSSLVASPCEASDMLEAIVARGGVAEALPVDRPGWLVH